MKQRIREFLKANPFRPFIIRMADGSEQYVDHPDFCLAAPDTLHVYIESREGDVKFLSALLIVAVEHAPAQWPKLKKTARAKP